MNKTKNYDQSDLVLANTIGISVEQYLSAIKLMDQDQLNSIMTRLLSDHDSEIQEGIRMFKDFI